jgi:hypothetical protein
MGVLLSWIIMVLPINRQIRSLRQQLRQAERISVQSHQEPPRRVEAWEQKLPLAYEPQERQSLSLIERIAQDARRRDGVAAVHPIPDNGPLHISTNQTSAHLPTSLGLERPRSLIEPSASKSGLVHNNPNNAVWAAAEILPSH